MEYAPSAAKIAPFLLSPPFSILLIRLLPLSCLHKERKKREKGEREREEI